MDEDTAKDLGLNENSENKDASTGITKKRMGFFSRILNGIFRSHSDDFEKKLQFISKEEATVLGRIKRRSLNSRKMAHNLIIFSIFLEVIAVIYAIMTTRSLDMNWKVRALRVLPMFLLPCLSVAAYSGLASFTNMFNLKDQETLERLRAERQDKIDELKERTNYYITQQLIQRYDPDPASKAAAAKILASKLGADSGLKLYYGDDIVLQTSTGKSNDVELVQSNTGLRNRRQSHTRMQHSDAEMNDEDGNTGSGVSEYNQAEGVEHHHHDGSVSSTNDGGWISRMAALLVGEDPTQCYALICCNCHMHNGLARKEELPYITYYCPHCHVLNKSKEMDGIISSDMVIASTNDVVSTENTSVSTGSKIDEISDDIPNDSVN